MVRLRHIALTAGLLLTGGATAGGRAADTSGQKPVNDAITATKTDLEALKTDRVMSIDPKLSLPGMEAPALSLPLPQPSPASLQNSPGNGASSAAIAGGKSATWLIDAMEKNSPRPSDERNRDKTGRSRATTDFSGEAGAKENDPFAVDRPDRGQPARKEAGELSAVKDAPNPLAGYMAGWMTSRDFNLLLKPEGTGGTAAPVSSLDLPGPSLALPGIANLPASLAGSGPISGPDFGGNSGIRALENPYLPSVALPSPQPLPPLELSSPLAAPRSAPLAAPVVAEPEKVAPFRLETQKRDDDAKYFPQLKRF